MTGHLATLHVRNRQHWRAWLEKNHESSRGVWIVFHKRHTGKKCISYDDSVREALCFGWIDSLGKRLDENRYLRKVTPRRPGSKWSDINRQRWKELRTAGLLAAAGLRASPTSNSYGPPPVIPKLPAYIATALKASPNAWKFFHRLAPSYRRQFVVWIHSAVRQETRNKRIRESIVLLAAEKRLGLK